MLGPKMQNFMLTPHIECIESGFISLCENLSSALLHHHLDSEPNVSFLAFVYQNEMKCNFSLLETNRPTLIL